MRWIWPLLLVLSTCWTALGQEPGTDGKILLTVILRQDQSKTLDEIDDQLAKTGFYKTFPPEGVEIVSYYLVMGVGHIITLRLPPNKVRDVNVAFEKGVWGAFRTEFYVSYDYLPIFKELKEAETTSQPSPTAAPKTPEATPEKSPAPSETPVQKRRLHRRSS
ncbi:MAG: hypothetical protein JO331_08020 [Verrucomicrobia bacterium]|nr:hypothetical protein [Verrucomicrobiota bacterium]